MQQLDLMTAISKMTLMPAERIAPYAPAMKNKGRLRVGADADITVFDPARIIDRATYEKPMQYSEGVVHVLVDGKFVVRDEQFVADVFPGKQVLRGVELNR
jgi:dihydroorotase